MASVGRALVVAALLVACHDDPPPLRPLPRATIASYLDARLAAATGDWATMADDLAEAAAAAPDEPMIAVELARAQAKAGREVAARATIIAARSKWPKHSQVWLASGDLLAKVAPDEAAKAYRRAIELDDTDASAYLGLARVHPADAVDTLRDLVKHVPSSVEGHYRLAQKLTGDAQIEELEVVLERDPDQIDARLELARVLRRRGDLAGAIAHTRSAFDRTGQALDVAEELFWLLCEADDVAGATDLLTLLDDNLADLDALALVARLDRGLGRIDAARAVGAEISAKDPDAGAIIGAETELAAGDPAAAVQQALAVDDSSERFAVARRVAAEAYLAANDPEHAHGVLVAARAKLPDDVTLALADAFALVDAGKPTDARAVLDAITPGKHAAELALAYARLADHAGDKRDAITRLDAYIGAHPDDAIALNLCGYLLADGGTRLPDAERFLKKARDLAPGDPAILDSFGWLQLRQGHPKLAVKTIDHASRLAPREPEILVHLAAAQAADGDPGAAGRTLDRAAALHPPAAVQKKIGDLRASLHSRDRASGQ